MMGAAAREPTALIVVAAWHEGSPRRLAARITYTVDASQPSRVTVLAAGLDEIEAVIGDWLNEVAAAGQRDAAVTDE